MKSTAQKLLIYILVPLLFISCNTSSAEKKSGALNGYNLNKPERFSMPSSLIEISGIAFNHGVPDVIYAIQDEEGKFYKITPGIKKQTHSKFAKSGDYEDVAITHDRAVVLKSNGSLYSFNLSDAGGDEIEQVKEWKHLLPEGEYESMYADDVSDQLFVLCKNCDEDQGNKGLSGFIFRFDDSIYKTGEFFVDASSAKGLDKEIQKGLRASALAKNPLTHEWYVLSSVNKLLLIVDEQWKIKEAVKLDPTTFNQPEGMAFDNAGNLYISNEGGDLAEGNILKFIRQKQK